MLKLHYIIIGELRGRQRSYLEQNLLYDKVEEKDIQVVWLEDEESRLGEKIDFCRLPSSESVFVSGNYKELQKAIEHGMATLGHLQVEKCARDNIGNEQEKCEYQYQLPCPDTDMWAEGFEEIDLEFLVHVYERHHGLPWTILTTERCVVKEFSMDYLDALFELYAGEGMTDYIEPLYPYEQEKEYQEAYIKNMYGFYGYGMWIVCDKDTGKLIGRAGLEHREELDGEMELGYAIAVPYQRQGYATEVCRAILQYAKRELLQSSVCCLIEEGNHVSERFAEKIGFSLEDTLVIEAKQMKKYVYVF